MKFEKLLLAAATLCLVCVVPSCGDDDPATDPEKSETPDTPEGGGVMNPNNRKNPTSLR